MQATMAKNIVKSYKKVKARNFKDAKNTWVFFFTGKSPRVLQCAYRFKSNTTIKRGDGWGGVKNMNHRK